MEAGTFLLLASQFLVQMDPSPGPLLPPQDGQAKPRGPGFGDSGTLHSSRHVG